MDAFHAELEPKRRFSNFAANLDNDLAVAETAKSDAIYEMHPISTHLSERPRRPSTVTRADTDKLSGSVTGVCTPTLEPSSRSEEVVLSCSADSLNRSQRPTKEQKRSSIIHFVTLCWCVWLVGWNDGTTGPLLPRIQERYNVRISR